MIFSKAKSDNGGGAGIKRFIIPAIFFFAGIAFMLVGVYRGEAGIVLRKAVNICLECIGIG